MAANAGDPSAVDGGDGGDRKIAGPGWHAALLPVQRISHLEGPRGALTGHPASSPASTWAQYIYIHIPYMHPTYTDIQSSGERGFRVCEGLERGGHWSWGVRANQVP